MRIALYYRVSTEDQTVDNQRPECEAFARSRGWLGLEPYVIEETGSGAKKLVGWARVLELAREGKIGRVVAWSLDRVGRTLWGIADSVRALDKFGAPLVTVKEPWLDLETFSRGDELTAQFLRAQLVHLFAYVAAFERRRLIDRTMVGLENARRRGNVGGRPRVVMGRALDLAQQLRQSGGLTWIQIAKLVHEQTGKKHHPGSLARAVGRLEDQAR